MNSCGADAPRAFQTRFSPVDITQKQFDEFLALRKLENLHRDWLSAIRRYLTKYLKFVKWKIDKGKTIQYLQMIKEETSVCYYRKQSFQIKKFLVFIRVDWVNTIKLPAEPQYLPKRLTVKDIGKLITNFPDAKPLILLGCSSGLRASELYNLRKQDIDFDQRSIRVNHSKTGRPRIAFFNNETKEALVDFHGFSKSYYGKLLRSSPIKSKDFRKFFSQEWDRRGGSTSIKKIIMGHSLKGDVDLQHYNYQSEDDLKMIYDRVMNNTSSLFT